MQKKGIFCTKILLPGLYTSKEFIRFMRICALIFAGVVGVSQMLLADTGYGQGNVNTKVDLDFNNESLSVIFKSIENQANLIIFYEGSKITSKTRASIKEKNISVKNALDKILKDKNYKWETRDNIIRITQSEASETIPNPAGHLSTPLLDPPPIKISGTVVGANNQPLAGATIRVKGKSISTTTNEKGYFEISADAGSFLIISYIGFQQTELNVKNEDPVNIQLTQLNNSLDTAEVVFATGYQNIPRERATGSFVLVDKQTLNRTVSTNILDRLAYVAGSLRKTKNAGGSNVTDISIRGLSTINANRRPLIVVDGFPYEEQAQTNNIILQNLNPNDVESITILRDAAAASIWGARSANGVIVITTKNGRFNQRASIQLNSNWSINERPKLFKADIMSSADVIAFEKDLFDTGMYNDYDDLYPSFNSFPPLSPVIEILLAKRRHAITDEQAAAQLATLEKSDVRNDLLKYVLRPASTQQYNLNISGGNNKMSYYTSIGFDKNIGEKLASNDNRLTLNFKNTYKPIDNLELSAYINYTQSKSHSTVVEPSEYMPVGTWQFSAPYFKLADENGNPLTLPAPAGAGLRSAYLDTLTTPGLLDWYYRPIDEINNADFVTRNIATRFGGSIRYTIIPGVTIEASGQYEHSGINIDDYKNLKRFEVRDYINRFMFLDELGRPQYPIPMGGIMDNTASIQKYYQLRAALNVHRTFGIHKISALAGVERSQRDFQSNTNRKYGYDPVNQLFASNMDFKNPYIVRPDQYEWIINPGNYLRGTLNRFMSGFGNAAYSLLNKYTFTASARTDGSNYFGVNANQRFSPFWSVGASWDISRERFFKAQTFSNLKFRITYGYNGNLDNSISTKPTIRYNVGADPFNQGQPFATVALGNPSLSWEKVSSLNIGIDFGLLNNRITGSVDYYTKQTNNLIGPVPADITVGTSLFTGNITGMKGNGVDLQVNALLVDNAIRVQSSFSASYNTDKITRYYQSPLILESPLTYLAGSGIVGRPVSSMYSYRWGGLNPEDGSPMGIVNDEVVPFTTAIGYDTDSKPNTKPADLVFHGRSTPSVFGNMLNSITFRNFSLSFNMIYNLGFYFRKPTIRYSVIQNNLSGHGDYSRRWQKPGDELLTTVPSFGVDGRDDFYTQSEVLVERGDYIYLQDVNIGYQFNKSSFSRLPFQSAQIFVNVQYLGTIWKANKVGIDPHFLSTNNIPARRQIGLGMNINF